MKMRSTGHIARMLVLRTVILAEKSDETSYGLGLDGTTILKCVLKKQGTT